MANLKVSLDYFPHIQLTRSMEMIGAEFKEKGYSVMWTVFEEIFMRGEGYYCEWNDDVALMFVQLPWISVGVNAVSEILTAMFRRGILSGELFDKYGILTSEYVQEVYFTAVSRRKKVTAIREYLLISADKISDNVNIISQNANIISKNADRIPQRKVKESKENKSKENNRPPVYIELMLADGQTLAITNADIFNYENIFPELNIRKELVCMKTWLEQHPQGRRSIGRTRLFVEKWLYKKSKGGLSGGKDREYTDTAPTAASAYKGGTVL